MMSDPVFDTLRDCVREIVPEIEAERLTPDASLKALGANSIERAEILMEALDRLDLDLPISRFAQAANLGEIADILRAA